MHIVALWPHMHLRGKSFRYEAHYPDGRSEVLLSVPRYDFQWQSVYRFVEPRSFPTGTKIYCEAHWDNSRANPANPDPSRTVTWGEQSWDEMMMGYLDYYEDDAPAHRLETRLGGTGFASASARPRACVHWQSQCHPEKDGGWVALALPVLG